MASQATIELLLTMKAELCAYAHTSRHDCWAVASIKAPSFEPESKVPIDVVAVIDVSSSMAGAKIELVKQTLLFVIGQLNERDRFSLVTYHTDAYLQFGLIQMSQESKAIATSAIKALGCQGGTNLCQGLLKGMEEIAYHSGPEKAKVQSVLLLTDGVANKGLKTKEGILAQMLKIQNSQEKKAAKRNFDGTVYTFGFGADHDAGMLAAISKQGGGVYYFIDTNEKIPGSFADCLGGLQTVLGQNLSLELDILGDNQLYYVHSSRTGNWKSVNKSWTGSLGDIQFEEGRDIVINLILPALAASKTESVLKATLSYFNVISSSMQTISCDLVVNRTGAAPGAPNTDLDQQRNRVVAASTLKLAQALADRGNYMDAKKLLKKTITTILQSFSAQYDFSKALLVDLKKSKDSLHTSKRYLSHGKQYMCSKMQTHVEQRSNFIDDQKYYESSSKKALKSMISAPYALLESSDAGPVLPPPSHEQDDWITIPHLPPRSQAPLEPSQGPVLPRPVLLPRSQAPLEPSQGPVLPRPVLLPRSQAPLEPSQGPVLPRPVLLPRSQASLESSDAGRPVPITRPQSHASREPSAGPVLPPRPHASLAPYQGPIQPPSSQPPPPYTLLPPPYSPLPASLGPSDGPLPPLQPPASLERSQDPAPPESH